MSRVLLIDGDLDAGEVISQVLARSHYEVMWAQRGGEAIHIVSDFAPAITIINATLPDRPGLDVLRQLRTLAPGSGYIITSDSRSEGAIISAMRAGACDWLSRPVDDVDLLQAVARARSLDRLTLPRTRTASHAADRLVEKLALLLAAQRDAPTLREFGRAVGISAGGLRNWCRTAHLPCRSFLRFGRALRAVYRHQQDPHTAVEDLLDIVDRRTFTKFILAAGGDGTHLPATVEDYLQKQQFITEATMLSAVRRLLHLRK